MRARTHRNIHTRADARASPHAHTHTHARAHTHTHSNAHRVCVHARTHSNARPPVASSTAALKTAWMVNRLRGARRRADPPSLPQPEFLVAAGGTRPPPLEPSVRDRTSSPPGLAERPSCWIGGPIPQREPPDAQRWQSPPCRWNSAPRGGEAALTIWLLARDRSIQPPATWSDPTADPCTSA